MTKRRRGTISVPYSAETAAEAPPRPVARSRLQGRGAAADGAAARGPCWRRATSPCCPFHSSFRGQRPPLPSYLPVPRDLLRGNVPRDRSRGLLSRRSMFQPSGVARPRVRRRAPSPPPPPRPRARGRHARRFGGLVREGASLAAANAA